MSYQSVPPKLPPSQSYLKDLIHDSAMNQSYATYQDIQDIQLQTPQNFNQSQMLNEVVRYEKQNTDDQICTMNLDPMMNFSSQNAFPLNVTSQNSFLYQQQDIHSRTNMQQLPSLRDVLKNEVIISSDSRYYQSQETSNPMAPSEDPLEVSTKGKGQYTNAETRLGQNLIETQQKLPGFKEIGIHQKSIGHCLTPKGKQHVSSPYFGPNGSHSPVNAPRLDLIMCHGLQEHEKEEQQQASSLTPKASVEQLLHCKSDFPSPIIVQTQLPSIKDVTSAPGQSLHLEVSTNPSSANNSSGGSASYINIPCSRDSMFTVQDGQKRQSVLGAQKNIGMMSLGVIDEKDANFNTSQILFTPNQKEKLPGLQGLQAGTPEQLQIQQKRFSFDLASNHHYLVQDQGSDTKMIPNNISQQTSLNRYPPPPHFNFNQQYQMRDQSRINLIPNMQNSLTELDHEDYSNESESQESSSSPLNSKVSDHNSQFQFVDNYARQRYIQSSQPKVQNDHLRQSRMEASQVRSKRSSQKFEMTFSKQENYSHKQNQFGDIVGQEILKNLSSSQNKFPDVCSLPCCNTSKSPKRKSQSPDSRKYQSEVEDRYVAYDAYFYQQAQMYYHSHHQQHQQHQQQSQYIPPQHFLKGNFGSVGCCCCEMTCPQTQTNNTCYSHYTEPARMRVKSPSQSHKSESKEKLNPENILCSSQLNLNSKLSSDSSQPHAKKFQSNRQVLHYHSREYASMGHQHFYHPHSSHHHRSSSFHQNGCHSEYHPQSRDSPKSQMRNQDTPIPKAHKFDTNQEKSPIFYHSDQRICKNPSQHQQINQQTEYSSYCEQCAAESNLLQIMNEEDRKMKDLERVQQHKAHFLSELAQHQRRQQEKFMLFFCSKVGECQTRKIGRFTLQERYIKIKAFKEKRENRVWKKKISYDCRKKVADKRLRIKGRFVSKAGEKLLFKDIFGDSNYPQDIEEIQKFNHQLHQLMSDYQKEKLKKSQLQLSDFVVHSKDLNGINQSTFDFNRLQEVVGEGDYQEITPIQQTSNLKQGQTSQQTKKKKKFSSSKKQKSGVKQKNLHSNKKQKESTKLVGSVSDEKKKLQFDKTTCETFSRSMLQESQDTPKFVQQQVISSSSKKIKKSKVAS